MARYIVVAPLVSSPPEPQTVDVQPAAVPVQPISLEFGGEPIAFPNAVGWGARALVDE